MKQKIFFLATLFFCLTFPDSAFATKFGKYSPSGHLLYYETNVGGVYVTTPTATNWAGYTMPVGDVVIPSTVTYLGTTYTVYGIRYRAFAGCTGITSVTIPNSVNTIGWEAFAGCDGLSSITIPSSVSNIGYSAFMNCNGLTTVNYDATNCTSVSFSNPTFKNCSNITTINIGENVTNIPLFIFKGCSNIASIIVDSNNSVFDCRNNCNAIIKTSNNTLIFGCRNTMIPNTVTSIGQSAFRGCSNLLFIEIPNSVVTIGDSAFLLCSNLSSITLPSNLTTISAYLFASCSSLTSVSIPNNITSIGSCAFASCGSLSSVSIPNTVTHIGGSAFSGCTSIDSLVIPESVTSIGLYAFVNCDNLHVVNCKAINPPILGDDLFAIAFAGSTLSHIYVPCSSVSAYQSAQGWSDFSSIISRPPFEYTYTFCSSDNIRGDIGNISNLDCDSNVTVIVTSNYGYHFDNWSDGGTGNPRTFHITKDTNITAFFAKNIYQVSVVANDGIRGSVFGDDTVEYLDTITLTATANYGYHFAHWDDNNISNPRQVQVTQNRTYTAYFDYNQYSISLDVDTTIHGGVVGAGSYNYLSQRIISANPNYGYHFTQWGDGNTDNPRTITLTRDTAFTAFFAKNIYHVSVIANDDMRGSVTGGDTVEYLDTITLSATANYGYHFTHWDDNNTSNPRQLQVTQSKTYTAYFDYNQYTILLDVDTTIHGGVVGAGNYNYLSQRIISANPNYGYHFTHWCDGDTNNPRTITLTRDTAFTAFFAKNMYHVSVIANNETRGSVTGGDTVEYLDTITLSATANYGYHFAHWDDNNTSNPRQIQVTQNRTYTAYFDYNQYSISLDVDTTIHGSVEGAGNYHYLSSRTIMANPNYGYHFTQWSDGDTNNPRVITLTQDTAFVAHFAKNLYGITVLSADSLRGSVTGDTTAEYLNTVSITATANYGYHFTQWNDGDTSNPRLLVLTQDSIFTAIFSKSNYDIVLGVDTIIHGSVMGDGSFEYLDSCIVSATANYGYHFTHWGDGDTNNPRVIRLTQDTSLTAFFAKNIYSLTLQSNDLTAGEVYGDTICEYLDTVNIIASVIMSHYHFVRWSDGDTNATRIIVIDRDSIITAFFAIDTHTVTVTTNGYGAATGSSIVPYGSEVVITATAIDGYHFAKWSNGSRNNPDTITVTKDTLLTAIFADDLVPQICMVSVQDGRNVVIWEKGIEVMAYNIYREGNVTNEYELVGRVPYDSLSIWTDTASRPTTRSYRYRMTATDIYGYESDFGDIHKTMHLTINQGIGNHWNLVWTEYEGADYTTYVIYRGSNASNIQQIDMMAAGGNTTYTDENAPEGDVYYQVGVLMTTPCNPTKMSTISRSNIATNGNVEGIRDVYMGDFKVFSEYGKIVVEGVSSKPVQLFDMMGRALYTTANSYGKITIPVPSSGIYLVKVGDYPARKVVVVR